MTIICCMLALISSHLEPLKVRLASLLHFAHVDPEFVLCPAPD